MAEQLWKGRFSKAVDSRVNDFNSSIRFDQRMIAQDMRGSGVHAAMLARQGIISEQDCADILSGLASIADDLSSGALTIDPAAEAVAAALADYYKDAATVKVHGLNEPLPENGLYSNAMAGTDRMELYLTVNAAGDQMMLVSLFDNLGKGSSGAAVQCMNLMLGLEETKGLE